MSLLDTNGHLLRYAVDGDASAPALLLVNSLGTDLHLWDAQVEVLARHHWVIRYDLRGHGRSEAAPGEYALADLGDDAIAVLDDLGIEDVAVCGISLGGLVGLWLAHNAAHRVRCLTVANSAARIGTKEAWEQRIRAVEAEGMQGIAAMVTERFFSGGFRARHPVQVDAFAATVRTTDQNGYTGCCAALRDADLTGAVPSLAQPLLVIGSSQDVATPWAQAEWLAAHAPDARLCRLPGGHLSNVENPSGFTSALSAFLAPDACRTR